MKQKYGILLLIVTFVSTTFAQKKPIDHSLYDNWNSISDPNISKKGDYIFYSIEPQENDGLSVLKNSNNDIIIEIPRGKNINLSEDEKFLIATIKPMFQQIRLAKIKKVSADQMPKDSLFVLNINTKVSQVFAQIKSVQTSRKIKNYIAFQTVQSKINPSNNNEKNSTISSNKKVDNNGTLHLLNLSTGDTTNFFDVENYSLSEDEESLLFTRKENHKDSFANSGLFLYDILAEQTKKISHGNGVYKQFTFSDQGDKLIFLADKSPKNSLLKNYKLYYYTINQDTASILVQNNSKGIPENWQVSGDGALSFSKSAERIFLALAPIPKLKDTTLVDFEHAKLDIWHWKDDYLQPMQLINLKSDQSRSYVAMIDLKTAKNIIRPLSDITYNRITFTSEADNEWALATSDQNYRIESQWEGGGKSDIYVISMLTSENKLVAKDIKGQTYLSPNGKYVLYYNHKNSSWCTYEIEHEKTSELKSNIQYSFVDEQNDVPSEPRPYGVAGWSKDGKHVYIYDRYDIWKFDLDGHKKSMITSGKGRKNEIIYRIQNLRKEEDPRIRFNSIDENESIYLNGFNQKTKYSGLYKIENKTLKQLWSKPNTFKYYMANLGHDKIIYTKESYENSPDLYLLTKLNNETKLTDINPQQSNYNWGTAELVEWITPKGFKAEGLLYKPENFDPNKKYPVIAYFYEKLSDGLYTYHAPTPTPSRLNISYFVSNEYLIFAPNIQYEIGYPGKSAEEFVNSGMRYLYTNYSWVDSTKMGIQGQSWGGYQVAHLITRTNMYAAAWSGAPVVNMTSAYGGIRWGTGMSRQFQYEHTQSRIGKPLWEALDLYIENSPLFFMNQVNTPVAIMHNDHDGAVPWYQGIEFFTALRRLNKPVWLLNYNGDEHNLTLRQNKKDIQIREAQFFDHFLKGKPAADWIKKGVKATEKGIDWGLDIN